MPAILYGPAYNAIYLVSMVFDSVEEGLDFLRPIAGEPLDRNGEYVFTVWEVEGDTFLFLKPELRERMKELAREKDIDIESMKRSQYDEVRQIEKVITKEAKESDGFLKVESKVFFKRYYGGNGDVGQLILKEVKPGEPIFPWDLD